MSNLDLGTIFRLVSKYLDEGHSWYYATAKAGIKKHRLPLLLATCPQLQALKLEHYKRNPLNQRWP